MPRFKLGPADLLLILQIILSWVASLSQVGRLLQTTQGVSPTWIVFWGGFAAINLVLAIEGHRESRSHKSRLLIWVYANSLLLSLLNLVVIFWRGSWDKFDSVVSVIVVMPIMVTLRAGLVFL